ncbi:MAG: ClbS/DfsB family four-helix bundle protein [Candidatus Heimdallarchaeota archaeon]
MRKQVLIEISERKRSLLDKLMEKILEKNDLLTLVTDKWRVKDVMAHIFWYEKEIEKMIKLMTLEGSQYWLLPTHERNERIFQDYYNQSKKEMLKEYKESFSPMIDQLNQLSENAMIDPSLYNNMPPDWKPWKVFAGNMFKHYEDHITQLQNRFDYLSEFN